MSTTATLDIPQAVSAEVTEDELTVHLSDGRTVTTPLAWYPRLMFATPEELQNFEVMPPGNGLHWPDLDEHLSVQGMVLGWQSGEGGRSLIGWKGAMQERRRLRAEGKQLPEWGTGAYRVPYRPFQTNAGH